LETQETLGNGTSEIRTVEAFFLPRLELLRKLKDLNFTNGSHSTNALRPCFRTAQGKHDRLASVRKSCAGLLCTRFGRYGDIFEWLISPTRNRLLP
jgi:hypothetical protein